MRAAGLDSLGDIKFGSVTTEWFTKHVIGPWFDHELDGGPMPTIAEATVFMTGQNDWRQLDAWPPRTERTMLYFGENRRLTWTKPGATNAKMKINEHVYRDGTRSRWYVDLRIANSVLAKIPMDRRGAWTSCCPLKTSEGIWRIDDKKGE